ncbi:MAG: hypothetical protein AAF990_21835 [Bacteroidota bacterium]
MKYFSTLLTALLLWSLPATGQNVLYDALTLADRILYDDGSLVIPIEDSVTYGILLKYIPELSSPSSMSAIEKAFADADNPFIGGSESVIVFPGGSRSDNTSSIRAASTSVGSSGAISTIADGLARFLVERFRQEMNIQFISKFKDFLAAYPEAQVLFPKSYSVLEQIETYHYAAILQVLKESFEKDVELLSNNFIDLRGLNQSADCPNCDGISDEKKKVECEKRRRECMRRLGMWQSFFQSERGALLITSMLSVQEIQEGNSPAVILKNLVADSSSNYLPSNLHNAMKLTNVFAQSLVDSDGSWVKELKIKSFLQNKTAVNLLLGLLYQQVGDKLTFDIANAGGIVNKVTFRKLLAQSKGKVENVTEFLETLSEVTSDLEAHFASLKASITQERKLNFFDYHKFLTSLGDLVEASLSSKKLFTLIDPNFAFPPEIKTTLNDYYRPALDISYDIVEKNYSAAVYGLVNILTQTGSVDSNFIQKLRTYGLFVAEVAKAETSEEVKEAIEAVALPVGSARIKRQSRRNVAVQSYLGGFGGVEIIPGLDTDSTESTGFLAAVHAPVGIAFSSGTEEGNSWSLFITAVDIGALTAYRFNDDQTEALPDFKLQNILAPGAYIMYGFKDSPVSIGAGVQMGPAVRKFASDENGVTVDIGNKANWRAGISIAVDIPLFNISTKARIDD